MNSLLRSRWGVPALLLALLALAIALGVAAGAGGSSQSATVDGETESASAQQLPAAPAPRPTIASGRDPFAIPGGAPVTFTPAPVPTGTTVPAPRTYSPTPYPTTTGKEGSVASPSSGSGGAGSLGGRTVKVVSVDAKLGAALVELDGERVLLKLGDGANDHFLVEISDDCAGIRSYIAGREIENSICAGESVEIITR